jgi:hypothetical protein
MAHASMEQSTDLIVHDFDRATRPVLDSLCQRLFYLGECSLVAQVGGAKACGQQLVGGRIIRHRTNIPFLCLHYVPGLE